MRVTLSGFVPMRVRAVVGAIALSIGGAAAFSPPQTTGGPANRATPGWITAWGTSHQRLGEAGMTNATVRIIARVTIPGGAVRIRLDNTFGTEPVAIGRAHVGYRVRRAALAAGSNRRVTFKGNQATTIPAGGSIVSDPVSLPVVARQDLAISLHIPATSVKPSQHTGAVVTSYRSADASGDVTADESGMPFEATITSTWWLKSIDVQSDASDGAIVAFGDSITDGTCSTLDAHDRWQDVLSLRLLLAGQEDAGVRIAENGLKAVINEGIGGNTITREGLVPPPDSPPGVERLDRDVLGHHGVSDVVLFMGTNDIRRGASTEGVIAGMKSIIGRVKSKGLRIAGATIVPRHNAAPSQSNTGWDAQKTRIRNEVNRWIRESGSFDHVIDFDAVLRDPADPDRIYPPFDCGDGIHPSPAGYLSMGRSVNLSWFREPRGRPR